MAWTCGENASSNATLAFAIAEVSVHFS